MPFLRHPETENTPVVSSRPVNEDWKNRGWQRSTVDAYQEGSQTPPDATDTEDNGCACVAGAFFLCLTETDLAAAFNEVRLACWLYFITEHRPHRHNKLRQGDLCMSEISSSKANMPDILGPATPILQSPDLTSNNPRVSSLIPPPLFYLLH